MEDLWCKLEILRQRMHEIVLETGISHTDASACYCN